jgi:tetratricopeptide (TPR) repeat protein
MSMKLKRNKAAKPARAPEALSAEMQRVLDEALKAHQRGQTDAAIEGYRKVLAVAPREVDALMNLGSALTEKGRAGEAISLLRCAREAGPKLPRLHNDVGVCLFELGRHDEAIAAFQSAVTLAPAYPEAWKNLGKTLLEAGRNAEAIAALQTAVMQEPLLSQAWFELYHALFDDKNLGPGVEALTRSVAADPKFQWARFSLAVALELLGDKRAAKQQLAMLASEENKIGRAVESWEYIKDKRTAHTRFFPTVRSTLLFALEQAKLDGLSVELGVRYGVSTRWIADAVPSSTLHAFDSFQGLPEDWHIQPRGIYSTFGEVPELPGNVEVHVGRFEDTLAPFAQEHGGPLRFLHVDCDLYSSTKTGLDALGDRIVPGSVIVFDEYLLNDWWREDEYKAFQEIVAARGWKYEYVAFGLWTGQAAVRIL